MISNNLETVQDRT